MDKNDCSGISVYDPWNTWYWPYQTYCPPVWYSSNIDSLAADIKKLPKLENGKVTIEVPGFCKEDLVVELKNGDLIVTGSVKKDQYSKTINQYVYVGDVVVKSAKLNDGLLVIETENIETPKTIIEIE